MIRLLQGVATAAACPFAGGAVGQTAPVDAHLGVALSSGSIIDVTLQITGEETFKGRKTRLAPARFEYRQSLERTAEGYRVTQTLIDKRGAESLRLTERIPSRIVFDTDARLRPIRIVNWRETMAAGVRRADELVRLNPDFQATQQGMAEMAAMSPEEAAAMLLIDQATTSTGAARSGGKCSRKLDRKTQLAVRTTCLVDIQLSDQHRILERTRIAQAVVEPGVR